MKKVKSVRHWVTNSPRVEKFVPPLIFISNAELSAIDDLVHLSFIIFHHS